MKRSEVGLLLASARARAGMTQAKLAEAMGTTQPVIARAEGGYRMPTLEFIDRWARASGSTLSITFGKQVRPHRSAKEKRAAVEAVLGPGRFNPWDRNLSDVEASLLVKAGRDRAYFRRLKSASEQKRRPGAR